MRRTLVALILLVLSPIAVAQDSPEPIIDMHLHALPADFNGPPPTVFCSPPIEYPAAVAGEPWGATFSRWMKDTKCENGLRGPLTDEGVMTQSLEILSRRNIFAVTSGSLLDAWRKAGGDRIIPGFAFQFSMPSAPTPAELRDVLSKKGFAVFGEITIQYEGIAPSDPQFDPYLAVAEELDVPVGIHIGPGPPGAPYLGSPKYRARLHSPLLIEDALVKHQKLRVYVMHAGWPMIDDLLALMWTYPQVYVDSGVIGYALPRAEFHRYLRRIVESGFGKRVMFGSDQMNWPGAIERSIEAIESADFLSSEQKRDIFYNNAARFLRLTDAEIARHHGNR